MMDFLKNLQNMMGGSAEDMQKQMEQMQQQMQQQMYPVNNTAFQNPPMPMNNGWVNPMMGQPQMGYGYGNMMVNPVAVQNTMNYGRLR